MSLYRSWLWALDSASECRLVLVLNSRLVLQSESAFPSCSSELVLVLQSELAFPSPSELVLQLSWASASVWKSVSRQALVSMLASQSQFRWV